MVKNLPVKAGNVSLTPGSGRSPEEGNDFCCSVMSDSAVPWTAACQDSLYSILAWEIPWTEETGRLESMGSQKSWTLLSN